MAATAEIDGRTDNIFLLCAEFFFFVLTGQKLPVAPPWFPAAGNSEYSTHNYDYEYDAAAERISDIELILS